MPTFVYRNGRMVDKATGEPMVSDKNRARPPAAPRVFGDFEGYQSPITGDWIEGRRARKYDLERHNCVDGNDIGSPSGGKLKNERFAKKHGLEHLLS